VDDVLLSVSPDPDQTLVELSLERLTVLLSVGAKTPVGYNTYDNVVQSFLQTIKKYVRL